MKVVVAIDGSEHTTLIIQNLKALAPMEDILLLHALQVPQLAYPGTGMSIGHEFSKHAEEALREDGTRILEDVALQLPDDLGPIHQRLELGHPAEVILSISEREKPDLIIVGSRGLGVIREQALGSVSHRVMTHTPCSTLVVKGKNDSFQNVLVPIEHKTDAEHIVSFLSTHPFRGKVHLTFLHVIPFAQPVLPVGALIPESMRKNLIEDSEQFTNEIATRLSAVGYATSTIVRSGAPSIVIHEEARRLGANLIVMERQKKDTLNRFLLGSVSHSVTHHGTYSVLLLK
ncbi:MAG: hypothetical protein NPIRA04_02200 [Nitrospirales bacterium]|nr:MAG: hypothetical protein NPIRA04_02200 [Nitrospirales bacterium]